MNRKLLLQTTSYYGKLKFILVVAFQIISAGNFTSSTGYVYRKLCVLHAECAEANLKASIYISGPRPNPGQTPPPIPLKTFGQSTIANMPLTSTPLPRSAR